MALSKNWVALYVYTFKRFSSVYNTVYHGRTETVRLFIYKHKSGVHYSCNTDNPGVYGHVTEKQFTAIQAQDRFYRLATELEALLLNYPKPPTLNKQAKSRIHKNRKMRNTAPR